MKIVKTCGTQLKMYTASQWWKKIIDLNMDWYTLVARSETWIIEHCRVFSHLTGLTGHFIKILATQKRYICRAPGFWVRKTIFRNKGNPWFFLIFLVFTGVFLNLFTPTFFYALKSEILHAPFHRKLIARKFSRVTFYFTGSSSPKLSRVTQKVSWKKKSEMEWR